MRFHKAAVLSIIQSAAAFSSYTPTSFQHSASLLSSSKQNPKQTRLMCGLIAAIDDVWSSGSDESSEIPILQNELLLEQATDILYHRGPDGMTCYSGNVGDARYAMGHTRLAIVDPENRAADMPFQLEFDEKKIKLAANGEIYNHLSIYDELKADGWKHDRISGSDCEVIAHSFAKYGGPATAAKLDGMFAFVVFEESSDGVKAFAARDPVGIKPLYLGKALDGKGDKASGYVFASELKALVNHVVPETVKAIPAGHYWTPEEGLVCYYNPDWLRKDDFAPWDSKDTPQVTDEQLKDSFDASIRKRMMSDVDYGFFLSGGVDSACVAHSLLPMYRDAKLEESKISGEAMTPIPTFTVGMENSPDVMAAKAVVEDLGGSKYIDHKIRYFTPDEVFDTIPKIIYHMETYEAELIRSSIPNWFLAEHAAKDVKMVLTGEGSDELFAGYLYFQDAENKIQVQNELRRIYGMLGNINLHRTDRMTMAHGLEARVPFLDTEFTRLAMSIDPQRKVVDPVAVKNNARGREKTLLRELFEEPNANGDSLPRPVLWRAKAMQCEGVGEDWVSILQNKVRSLVSDEDYARAPELFPLNTPQTKEEFYYRRIFAENFPGMDHVVTPWEGGGRAMGAAWKSDMYTREGLKNVDMLTHSLQETTKKTSSSTVLAANHCDEKKKGLSYGFSGGANAINNDGLGRRDMTAFVSSSADTTTTTSTTAEIMEIESVTSTTSTSESYIEEVKSGAAIFGYDEFEQMLCTGGDDRSLIDSTTGANKYHIRPFPISQDEIFRGSCTGNPPTSRGYEAAKELYEQKLQNPIGGIAALNDELNNIFENQRQRIAKCLDLPPGSEVILCPSGSDAEYIPVAIAQCLHPDKAISNGISQLNEIGAGSAPASVGKFFSTHAPFLGEISSDTYLNGLDGFENVEGIVVCARNKDGSVVDVSSQMSSFRKEELAAGRFPILHGVFGGKTGVRDEVMPGSDDAGDTTLGVVDACQGRFTAEEMKSWLDQDSLVLFTASKFYQAPPFCGAVIISKRIAEKLRNTATPPTKMLSPVGLGAFLTDAELPACLEVWKGGPLDGNKSNSYNVGLALRWEAGLAGMEAIGHISDIERTNLSKEWASKIEEMVDSNEMLETFCVERSIVSIRIKKKVGDSDWLRMDEARSLFRWMTLDVSHAIENYDPGSEMMHVLSIPMFIGQPVNVSEEYAIVRMALGVESLLAYSNDKEGTLYEDLQTVQKLGALAKYFDALSESGI